MASFTDIETAKSISRVLKHRLMTRFKDPVECLTAHLIFESSEVLAKTKPANLVSLVNRPLSCGANLFELWNRHHQDVMERLDGLNLKVLKSSEKSILLFCYNSELLSQHLSHPGIMAILARSGYKAPATSEELLNELLQRMKQNDSFPHEIGFFIGYPAKDVAAFMGLIKIPFTCQGPWKIFGDPANSLKLVSSHMMSRVAVGKKLHQCSSPFECFSQAKSESFL